MNEITRRRYTFRGIIQGVGFRPTIYRCASTLGLSGFVRNQRSEVVAEVQGHPKVVAQFPQTLENMLPKAALIERMEEETCPTRREEGFQIVESKSTTYSFPPIPPALAICSECREELFDTGNRRYLYPFITCTQCGPRYSIVEDTPFDRETTSMIDFPQCPNCLAEYTNPEDRRFHSQTNSCTNCGPLLGFKAATGTEPPGDPIVETIRALIIGRIVAIQGIGGFHLAANPGSPNTVKKLRSDKERLGKPFALMVRDLTVAESLCRLSERDRQQLQSPASPIVISPIKDIPDTLTGVSNTGTLGLMLPYTPLHLLLFLHPQIEIPYSYLIMTSGNLKGESIVTEPRIAFEKLSGIAQFFLYNNRRIIFRTDDSIVRTLERDDILLRRSRGFVPRLIGLQNPVDNITLAVGGDLKNAPALARDNDIYLAPYLGDLEDISISRDFERQIDKILDLYGVRPELLVYDLHPGYYSTRWALQAPIERKAGVQHHHAHLLSVMAEHQLEKVIGLAFDGTGYGTDGTIWGGEFLLATRKNCRRFGCFQPFPLPGGEAAVLHPLRIAVGLLARELSNHELHLLFCSELGMRQEELDMLLSMLERNLNSPLCSSVGRIFDAAAALLGLVRETSYEGEGPIKLEGLALQEMPGDNDIGREVILTGEDSETFFLDPVPLLLRLARRRKQTRAGELALCFHQDMARSALKGARVLRERSGISTIVLSGGVFQNVLLHRLLRPLLEEAGFQVFSNRNVPAGDGGLAVGQVYFQP